MLYKHNQIEYFKAMMVDHFVCKYSKAWLQSKSNKFQYLLCWHLNCSSWLSPT